MRLRYLLQRVAGSIAQRGWRGTLARMRQEFESRPTHDDALDLFEVLMSTQLLARAEQ